jgi:hypothetical protein
VHIPEGESHAADDHRGWAEEVACPKCAHAFALTEGISRQAIERHAKDFDRSLAGRARKLEAELLADARRRAEREAAREIGALRTPRLRAGGGPAARDEARAS